MANQQQGGNPTAEQVEQQRIQQEQLERQQRGQGGQPRGAQDQQGGGQQQQQQQPQQQAQEAPQAGGGGNITKLTFQSQFVKIELTDPNILDELNTPEKYPNTIGFDRLEINVNKRGGRISLTTEDKKGISREALSGINPKETEGIKEWKIN